MLPPLNPLDVFLHEAKAAHGDRDVARFVISGERLTYADLADKACACATGLAALGVGSGSHVAMMLPSSPASIITWFALARLGAVLTPLNPGYVAEELAYVLDNSDAEFLIIDTGMSGLLDELEAEVAALKHVVVHGGHDRFSDWAELLEKGSDAAPQPMQPDGLFSIQYTSGTTGKPKGCMLSQTFWNQFRFNASAELDGLGVQNTMIWSPFFYLDAQWQLLACMELGATAHIVERMSLSKLGGWLEEYEIEYFSFPEPFMQSLDEAIVPNWPLKFVNTFAWRPHNIAKLRRMFGPIGRDAFGMTEVGVVSAAPLDLDLDAHSGSCGLAANGCSFRIVDEKGEEVPTGAIGELVVQTSQMLLGYYKNEEATAASYFGDWFRTGDLASVDDDGYLYIKGRLKEMIKRSGENIAAREVEAVILQHSAVQEVAVVGVPDPIRKEEVKAFIALRDSCAADKAQAMSIAEHCSGHLAAFKRPRFIEFVEDFPRTATRKVAKRQLACLPPVSDGPSWDRRMWDPSPQGN